MLSDAYTFFNDFDTFFNDFDLMKENIDELLVNSKKISQGFEMTKKIHVPVVSKAALNGRKANSCQKEIAKMSQEA